MIALEDSREEKRISVKNVPQKFIHYPDIHYKSDMHAKDHLGITVYTHTGMSHCHFSQKPGLD